MKIELKGQTLNVLVPTVIWTLSVVNMVVAVWGLSGIRFGLGLSAIIVVACGSAWAFDRATTLLRDQATAATRLLLYASLFGGMFAASWDLVPAWPWWEETEEPPPPPPPSGTVDLGDVSEDGKWVVPHAPPGPAKLPHVPDNVLELIGTAQRQLHAAKLDVGECGGKGEGQAQCLCDYLVAVTDASGTITLVEAYQDQESTPPGYKVKAQITPGFERACGTNPVLDVSHPPGQTVLAVRTVVKTTKTGSEVAVFTPFTDELDIPELRERGLAHWWATVTQAREDLRASGVRSSHVEGKLVADLIPPQHVFLLGIIENVGSLSPFGDNGSEAQRLRELRAVLIMYGANGANAFRWRVSRANAYGPLQFTPIYKGLRAQYPGVLPEGEWVDGAKDHRLAARAAFLHSDEEFRPLKKVWHEELPQHPLLYGLYLAAGYNGDARRVARGLENCSAEEWYGVTCPTLRGRNNEGHWYMRKYLALEPLLFDPRTHLRLSGTENAPPSEDEDAPAAD